MNKNHCEKKNKRNAYLIRFGYTARNFGNDIYGFVTSLRIDINYSKFTSFTCQFNSNFSSQSATSTGHLKYYTKKKKLMKSTKPKRIFITYL